MEVKNLNFNTHPDGKQDFANLRKHDTWPMMWRQYLYRCSWILAGSVEGPYRTDPPLLVPILRAGLGMLEGFWTRMPIAPVGMIGMERIDNPSGPLHQMNYCSLPDNVDELGGVVILDPMLATGGSAIAAVNVLRKRYSSVKITMMCVIAAPEGIVALNDAHPNVDVVAGQVDEGLDDRHFIVPGLGDAGDRLFGWRK